MTGYKYISSKFCSSMVKNGELLFRNLSSFKIMEHKQRGDRFEGMHRDSPATGATLKNLSAHTQVQGKFTFINEVDSDEIFVFCVSTKFDDLLFDKFEADCCIEFLDMEALRLKVQRAVYPRFPKSFAFGVHGREVIYYDPSDPLPENVDPTNPRELLFLKDKTFCSQYEYRIAFGRRKSSLSIGRKIVKPGYRYTEDLFTKTPMSLVVSLGSIEEICRVRKKSAG